MKRILKVEVLDPQSDKVRPAFVIGMEGNRYEVLIADDDEFAISFFDSETLLEERSPHRLLKVKKDLE